MSWLDEILLQNEKFRARIEIDQLPVQRNPCPYAIVTCMDPRINLEAAGVPGFDPRGKTLSNFRIIRTIGGMADERSLVIGIHLAGIKEIAVIMHTDCGCSLTHTKINTIINNLHNSLNKPQLDKFKSIVGEPFSEKLIEWLRAFDEPKRALMKEIETIRSYPYIPESLIVHGLLYDLASGRLDVIVNGYEHGK
jgi:carbonic anhydrase